ncbi:MAG TPA: ABC transporter permease [Gemmatimonadales bacterium]|jgi:predicted permease|nr:ABC transporter permease [Gemmatimonadales bacterium]
MREWLARLRDWLRRDRLDRELTEELRFHRQQLERDARAEGDGADEAPYAARRRLGNTTRYQEDARDRWSWPWLDHLQKDLRYALRGLRRSPGFTATVVLTLGLGIGANAAMFGVIDRLMFRPFPYLRDPARVHRVYLQTTYRGRTFTSGSGYEYATSLDLKKFSSGFDRYAFMANPVLAVGTGDDSQEQRIGTVSASFFDFFSVRPILGRFFTPGEDITPQGAPVVVLTYAFWMTQYGGRDVLGHTLQIGNILCTIIGVAPKGFVGVPDKTSPPVAFIPITTYAGYMGGLDDRKTYFSQYHWGWMSLMVHRKPGVSEAAASADLTRAYRQSFNVVRSLDPEVPSVTDANPTAIAGALKSSAGPDAGLEATTLLWVTGVAVVVLLIACANVTNLMFARVLRRRREFAVRLALGVSRGRLIAQTLTESLLLAGLGLVAGIVVAEWGGAALRRLFVSEGTLEVLTDWRTIGVAAAAAVVAGILSGSGPALLAIKGDLAGSLKAGAREGTHQPIRARGILLVTQGALSVLLLVGAGLFVKSLHNVRALRLGYDAAPVLMVSRNLRGMDLPDSVRIDLGRRLLAAAEAIPGVTHATQVSSVPFWSTSGRDLHVAGIDSVDRLGRFTVAAASPDYFRTMDTRILRGRPFTARDRDGTPRVAVVSQAMAEVLWPGQEALGQCFRIGADTMPCTTVIGIAENAVQRSLLGDERPYRYYLPIDQFEPARGNYLLLRMRGDSPQALEPIRKALQSVMPGQSYVTVRPLEEVVDQQRRSWQVGATMFVAFGVLALLVAAVGLYGMITYNVAQRMHELGVRIALGAQARDLVRLVVGQGLRFAMSGVAIGLAAALILAGWVQPLLFHQSARDPVTYGVVGAMLLAVAVVASAMPALRATRADPNSALRSD